MSNPLPIVEYARNLGMAFMAASWPFVVFDSLGKTVDVVALKSKLDLCEARHTAIVVRALEISLAPHIGTNLRSVDDDFDYDPDIQQTPQLLPQNLGDAAKDAIVVTLRNCDKILAGIHYVRHLPERVGRLNRRVYASSLAVAIAATTVTILCFLWPEMPRSLAWLLLGSLLMCISITVYFAASRQRQVHDADQKIVDEDPQPRV